MLEYWNHWHQVRVTVEWQFCCTLLYRKPVSLSSWFEPAACLAWFTLINLKAWDIYSYTILEQLMIHSRHCSRIRNETAYLNWTAHPSETCTTLPLDYIFCSKTLQPKVTYSSQSNMDKNQKIGIFFFIFWFSLRREGTHSEEASKREGSLVCKRDNTIFFIIVIYYQPGLHFKSSKSL